MTPKRRVLSVAAMAALGVLGTWIVSHGSGTFSSTSPGAPPEPLNGPYCGIYSLYYALRAIDVPVAFDSLADERYVGSGQGSSAEELRRAALDNGADAVVAEGMTVGTLLASSDPIILHVREPGHGTGYHHWLLFLGCDGGRSRIIDPSSQVATVPTAEILALWDGTGIIVARKAGVLSSAVPAWLDAVWVLSVGMLSVVGVAVVTGLAPRQTGRRALMQTARRMAALLLLAAALGAVWHTVRPEGYVGNRPAVGLVVEHRYAPDVPVIPIKELAPLVGRGDVTVIDARLPKDYLAGHLPGAVNVPISAGWIERQRLLTAVPPAGRVVVYCQSESCTWSDDIARALIARGHAAVAIYRGGYREWKQSGRPTVSN